MNNEFFTAEIDSTGWLSASSNTSRANSPNFNDRPYGIEPTLVVLHSISLPMGKFGGDNVKNLFLNKLKTSTPEFPIWRPGNFNPGFCLSWQASPRKPQEPRKQS